MKVIYFILFAMLYIFVQASFANQYTTQESIRDMHFKSIACDEYGTHCFGLSHNPEKKYSLMLYRTDNTGENWYKFKVGFYSRIGSDEKLDASAGMKIACDKYLQNCLIGVTIAHGQAFVFYGTNDGWQIWKGVTVWKEPTKKLQSSYIVQLTCDPSDGSRCHLLTDSNEIYIIEKAIDDSGTTGPDDLKITMRPMRSH